MILGIGTDLIEVARIKKNLDNANFLKKVFTAKELELSEFKQSKEQSLAARFAAKEACMKALGTGWTEGISFHEIEILNDEQGTPIVRLMGKALQKARDLEVKVIHATLSHIKDLATATVILEK